MKKKYLKLNKVTIVNLQKIVYKYRSFSHELEECDSWDDCL